jgi:nucleoside-diphosphate-sugar epimerase
VCERLVQAGVREVRALVHTIKRTPRIARLPIQLFMGDLLDPPTLAHAMGNATIVIHCGLGEGRDIVRGTRNLLKVAQSVGVSRFIHVSTAAVYGLRPPPGCETEDVPLRPTDDAYCDNKARAEGLVKRYGRQDLPVVILRPSIVYGPYSSWSTRLIGELREGHATLIDGGTGACNTTYVDNLIDAIFLSMQNEAAIGETFFITDGERITWGDFINAHVAMMDCTVSLPARSRKEIQALRDLQPGLWSASLKESFQVLLSPELRQLLRRIPLVRRVMIPIWEWLQGMDENTKEKLRTHLVGNVRPSSPPDVVHLPDAISVATQTGSVYFRIGKARRMIGYEPRIPFSEGIKRVEQWLRFANYL